MEKLIDQIYTNLGGYIPAIVGAILILLVGWLIALIVSTAIQKLLNKTTLDNKVSDFLGYDKEKKGLQVESGIAKSIYYLIMVFVLIALFQTLGLTIVTKPLNLLLSEIFEYVPNLLGTGLLLVLAWLIATVVKTIVTKALDATEFDDKLSSQAGIEKDDRVPLSVTLANVAYWLIFLLFLPAIIGSLGMEGLLKPVQTMMDNLLSFLPNLFGAGIILFFGWLVARIVRQILTNLLIAIGADQFGKKFGLGEKDNLTLSTIVGMVVYALILIPTVISSLDALKIEAISKPATEMLGTLMQAIPALFGAVVILSVTYIVARLVSNLVSNVLTGLGFNKILGLLGLQDGPKEGQRTPAEIVGYLVLIGFMLFATIEAMNLMGFVIIAQLVAEFLTFASQVMLGIFILGLGLYLANLASTIILGTAGEKARLMSQAAKLAIIVLSAAMGLQQMGIANDIINLAFGLLLGAIAVAIALAFGLGARDIAAKEVENWLNTIKKSEEGQ